MPAYMLPDAPYDPSQASGAITTVLMALGLLTQAIIAPTVEELYFRGHLLPRLAKFGPIRATVINSAFFALYHVFFPWKFLTIFVANLPLIYLAQRKQNIYLAIAAHVLVNLTLLLGIP